MSIKSEVARIKSAKGNIKEAIIAKGVEVADTDSIDTYAEKIASIRQGGTDYSTGIELPVESTLVKEKGRSPIYAATSPYIKIVDRTMREWTLAEWDERAQACNYSLTERERPVGISFRACGEAFVIYLDQWCGAYKDVCGDYNCTITNTSGINVYGQTLRHGQYNFTSLITGLSASVKTKTDKYTGVYGTAQSNCQHGVAGKYNSAEVTRSLREDGDYDFYVGNTKQAFILPSAGFNGYSAFFDAWRCKDVYAHVEMQILYNEIVRQMFAICSGIATAEVNGTKTNVDIVADGGEMYFAIGGTRTSLLAKYNLNNTPMSNTLHYTQAMADAVYARQKVNGINMNSEVIKTAGSKGAEAIAVDGYWYIMTPTLTNGATATTARAHANNEIPDNASTDWLQYAKERHDYNISSERITLASEIGMFLMWVNKAEIDAIRQYLFYEGWHNEPSFADDVKLRTGQFASTCWGGVRYIAYGAWSASFSSGYLYVNVTTVRYYVPLFSAL